MTEQSTPPVWFAIYDQATGRIRQTTYGMAAEAPLYLRQGEAWLVVDGPVNDRRQLVREGRLAARPVLTISKTRIKADGVDAAVIEGLPVPCTVTIDGEDTVVTDGVVELTAAAPHSWSVSIRDPFPYQRFEAVITAAEA